MARAKGTIDTSNVLRTISVEVKLDKPFYGSRE